MKRLFLIFTIVTLLPVSLSAAIPEEKAAEIKDTIKQKMDETLNQLVNAKKLCQRYAFVHPVEDVKNAPAKVDKMIEEEADKQASKKHPDSWIEEKVKLHSRAFEQWKAGEKRTFFFKGGLKKKPVTGHILEIQPKQIKVATQWYRKDDMTEETLLHFNKAHAARERQKLIDKFTIILKRNRAQYKQSIIYDIEEAMYKENGYIRINNVWTAKKAFINSQVQKEQELLRPRLIDMLTYKCHYEAGFRKYKDDWFTEDEVAQLIELERVVKELQPDEFVKEVNMLNEESKPWSSVKNIFDQK